MSRPRGHVRQHGAGWAVVVTVGKNPATGDPVKKWHTGYPTRRDAHRARTQILRQLDEAAYVGRSRRTVAQFLREDWLPAIRSRVRPNTWDLYRVTIDAYVVPRIGAVELQSLTPSDLNKLYADLLEQGGRGGRGLAPKTVRNVHTTLRKALADSVDWELLIRNPAERISPPRAPQPEMQTWTPGQLQRFLDHAAADRLYAAFLLAATTGARRSEILGLPWRAVNLEAGLIEIVQTSVMVGSAPTLSETKTASSRRPIRLDKATISALRHHRSSQNEERLSWGAGWRDSGLVFTKEDGSPLRPDEFSRRFKAACRGARVPSIGVHGLRHTWATLALREGIHPKVVAERLGHATVKTTLDRYSHVTSAMESDAAERVASLFLGS